MTYKTRYMQNVLKTASVITALVLLAACGGTTTKVEKGKDKIVAEKKAQLEKMRALLEEIRQRATQ